MSAPTAPQPHPAACPSCGRADPGAGAFCVGCGQSLSPAPAAAAEQEPPGSGLHRLVAAAGGQSLLPLVGFDVVEVSPPYDASEITALLAANLIYEVLLLLAAKADEGPKPRPKARARRARRP